MRRQLYYCSSKYAQHHHHQTRYFWKKQQFIYKHNSIITIRGVGIVRKQVKYSWVRQIEVLVTKRRQLRNMCFFGGPDRSEWEFTKWTDMCMWVPSSGRECTARNDIASLSYIARELCATHIYQYNQLKWYDNTTVKYKYMNDVIISNYNRQQRYLTILKWNQQNWLNIYYDYLLQFTFHKFFPHTPVFVSSFQKNLELTFIQEMPALCMKCNFKTKRRLLISH